jgi:outer membrane protein TolC
MVKKRFFTIALIFSSIGCATAGAGSYDTLHSDFERASPGARGGGGEGAKQGFGTVLDRTAFVQAVLCRNPTIESARQGWRAALSRVRQAGAFDDPMVDLGLAPLSLARARTRVGYEVALSQRLPWFGKRSSEAAAASAEAEAAKSDFEATRRALMLSALGLYDQYYVAVRSLEINAQHVELLRQLRSSAALQFESGRGSAQDPLQAEAELAHTEHESAVLSAQRDVTVAQMNELLHRPPEHPLPPPPKELALLKEPQGLDVKRLESQAVTGRPEIAAARQRARAEQARADRAGREYFPDFTVSTSYNSMWDMPEHRWMVGLGFNLPLQSGRRGGTADEAEAMRAQFENDARRMEDAARTQVFILMRQLDESKHVLSLFEERLLPVARNQVDAARASFISSRSPFSAVIEAEKNLRSAERDYQMARAECDRRRAELGIALGRFASLDCKGGER